MRDASLYRTTKESQVPLDRQARIYTQVHVTGSVHAHGGASCPTHLSRCSTPTSSASSAPTSLPTCSNVLEVGVPSCTATAEQCLPPTLVCDSLVSDNGNWLWELSNQIVQAILRHYYHCAHILVSEEKLSEKVTDPGKQAQGTASTSNEPSNTVAHSTVANHLVTTACERAKSCDAKGQFSLYTDK